VKVAVFGTKSYDKQYLTEANQTQGSPHELTFLEPRLSPDTVMLAQGFDAVCVFVNDNLNAEVIRRLADGGVRLIALRCAGFNNVDLQAARDYQITVVRVPKYSPYAVAEHALALIMTLNRKTHRAHARVRESNFELHGLMGFDIQAKTVGVIGTGQIGIEFARIMQAFNCVILGYDPFRNPAFEELGGAYVALEELFARADIISLHCPLTPETHHIINGRALAQMKAGVTLINTSRGALVDTVATIEALKSGKVGYLGLDVYEEESDLFFQDLSDQVMPDDVFARLLTFPNVLITGHQAFFTDTAVQNITETTINNISEFERSGEATNAVTIS
jgi:D-lactate dehydrogenase